MAVLYSQDGVDIQEGDSFSEAAGKVCRASWNNSRFIRVIDYSHGLFRGPRSIRYRNLPRGCTHDAAPDGIGTKVEIIDAALSHLLAARDVFAMTGGDITRYGGKSTAFVNVLDVKSLGKIGEAMNVALRQAIVGLGDVARDQGVVLFKGETAELNDCVSSSNRRALAPFNWAGVMLGIYHPKLLITGEGLEPGLAIVALKELGFRSNGISAVRKSFRNHYGKNWHWIQRAQKHVKAAAEPSVLYDRFLTIVNGWEDKKYQPLIKMHLIVHVTGGAIRSKLADDVLFPRGLSADLTDLWQPPEIMRLCAGWRGLDDEGFYETWNGGQGALVVISQEDVAGFVELAEQHGIEARQCGVITREQKPRVVILSKLTGEEIVLEQAL